MSQPVDSDESSVIYLRRRRYARICALRYLFQADLSERWEFSAELQALFWEQSAGLEDALDGADLTDARTYAVRLIEGVLANRERLDREISAAAQNWRLERMNTVDRNLMRVAAFEILLGNEAPPAVAMNEAIELAKDFGDKDSTRFINGVLDKLARSTPSVSETATADVSGKA